MTICASLSRPPCPATQLAAEAAAAAVTGPLMGAPPRTGRPLKTCVGDFDSVVAYRALVGPDDYWLRYAPAMSDLGRAHWPKKPPPKASD